MSNDKGNNEGDDKGNNESDAAMLIVLSTCPDLKIANAIATQLVEKHLAACVNILALEDSVYRWKGKIEHAKEFLLVIKTRKEKYILLEMEIKRMHPDEVPEIVAMKSEKVSREYLEWVRRCCLV
ncbi:TPA: divalent-cation tolerance protein CutA [Candidatus Micrarchaeota archaeon]|nr:divalent-cation tolerance protein CutA [Candidatus Micrarchaeota archaeon]